MAVAVQDHGFSPHGSNRVFRFGLWEQAVREGAPSATCSAHARPKRRPSSRACAPPPDLAAELARGGPVLAADTGPAALYGALPDGVDDAVLVNVGNGHTVVRRGPATAAWPACSSTTPALLDGPRPRDCLRRFLAGELGRRRGARRRRPRRRAGAAPPPAAVPLIVTGPRRDMLAGSSLPLPFAAPHGDMMLTGCFGLLRAFADRGVGAHT